MSIGIGLSLCIVDLGYPLALPLQWVAAVVAVVLPAGLGVRDIATATALSASIPFSVAVAASVAVRLLQTAIEIAYAGATAIWARQTAPAPNAPLN